MAKDPVLPPPSLAPLGRRDHQERPEGCRRRGNELKSPSRQVALSCQATLKRSRHTKSRPTVQLPSNQKLRICRTARQPIRRATAAAKLPSQTAKLSAVGVTGSRLSRRNANEAAEKPPEPHEPNQSRRREPPKPSKAAEPPEQPRYRGC